jgi:hypothetical protein
LARPEEVVPRDRRGGGEAYRCNEGCEGKGGKVSVQMNLGNLIDVLERKDPTAKVDYAFGYFSPTFFMSWRGAYEELALGYAHWNEIGFDKRPTVAVLLNLCNSADGETYQGYKGGEFTMDRGSRLWISNNGEACHSGLADVVEHDGSIVLVSAPFSWM